MPGCTPGRSESGFAVTAWLPVAAVAVLATLVIGYGSYLTQRHTKIS